MDLRESFLRDSADHLDDDAPRRVFADWLIDQDNETDADQGRLILLQCAGLAARKEVILREKLTANWEKRFHPFRVGGWERGFVAEVSTSCCVPRTFVSIRWYGTPNGHRPNSPSSRCGSCVTATAVVWWQMVASWAVCVTDAATIGVWLVCGPVTSQEISMTAVAEALLTAKDFAQLPRGARPCELVRGRVHEMNVPSPRHGQVCGRICRILGRYLDQHDIGHLVTNDGGVVTETDPDTVRGPDVGYFSYARVPPGPFPFGYLDAVPELVFEVLSPSDRWSEVLVKVNEYRNAGVDIVCVLDPVGQTATLFSATQAGVLFHATDTFALPVLFPGWAVLVRDFFA